MFLKRRLHKVWKPDYHQYVGRQQVIGPRFTESEAVRRFNSTPCMTYWSPFIPPARRPMRVVKTATPPQGIPIQAQRTWVKYKGGVIDD